MNSSNVSLGPTIRCHMVNRFDDMISKSLFPSIVSPFCCQIAAWDWKLVGISDLTVLLVGMVRSTKSGQLWWRNTSLWYSFAFCRAPSTLQLGRSFSTVLDQSEKTLEHVHNIRANEQSKFCLMSCEIISTWQPRCSVSECTTKWYIVINLPTLRLYWISVISHRSLSHRYNHQLISSLRCSEMAHISDNKPDGFEALPIYRRPKQDKDSGITVKVNNETKPVEFTQRVGGGEYMFQCVTA